MYGGLCDREGQLWWTERGDDGRAARAGLRILSPRPELVVRGWEPDVRMEMSSAHVMPCKCSCQLHRALPPAAVAIGC